MNELFLVYGVQSFGGIQAYFEKSSEFDVCVHVDEVSE